MARPKTVSTYHQSAACLGRVSKVESFDGAGALLRTEFNGFSTDIAVPFLCHNTSSETTEHQGPAFKTVKTIRNFNLDGEVTRDASYGNLAVTGDEVGVWTNYYPDTSAYVVACPAIRTTRSGVAATAPVIGYSTIRHDDAAHHSVPPSHCAPTVERVQLAGDPVVYADTAHAYDDYGNRTSSTDANGNLTATMYDPIYHLYPVKVQSPIPGLATETDWDTTCGAPSATRGFNAQQARFAGNSLHSPLQRERHRL